MPYPLRHITNHTSTLTPTEACQVSKVPQTPNPNTDSPLFGSDSSVSSCGSPSDMPYPLYSPFTTSLALTYQEPLLKENPDRFVIFLIEHLDLSILYKIAQASLWTAEEIGLSKDCECLAKLKQSEREYIFKILTFFAASDSIVNENLCQNFANEVLYPKLIVSMVFKL
jgi:hypothetical protein